jgi:hypothetical protein
MYRSVSNQLKVIAPDVWKRRVVLGDGVDRAQSCSLVLVARYAGVCYRQSSLLSLSSPELFASLKVRRMMKQWR